MPRSAAKLIPKDYERRATISHAERYVTPELKELELRLQTAQDEALELEKRLYAALVGTIDNVLKPLVVSGRAQISTLPVFLGLMGGLSAFGAIGMVLGPVIVALVIALLQFAEESRPTE